MRLNNIGDKFAKIMQEVCHEFVVELAHEMCQTENLFTKNHPVLMTTPDFVTLAHTHKNEFSGNSNNVLYFSEKNNHCLFITIL